MVGPKILVGMDADAGDGQLFEVPEGGEVRPGRGGVDKTFVSELVEDVFDLDVFYAVYTEKRGFPPYDPRLMVKLLLYGYTTGVRSSRAIEKRCAEDVAFRFLAANQQPDFRTPSSGPVPETSP